MNEKNFLGIDGGGSGLRVAIVDSAMRVICCVEASAANPNVIGPDEAQACIRDAVVQALSQAGRSPEDVGAAGIGVSGASQQHSREWLLTTLAPVLPISLIMPSSDLEIALVGALGQRQGVLILAGTGSAAFGIAPDGRSLQIGGWGYLLGDAGSGFWIGKQVLQSIIRKHENHPYANGETFASTFDQRILAELNLSNPRQLIAWLYRGQRAPPVQLADLARLVLKLAETGNWQAQNILQRAALHLVAQAKLLMKQLAYQDAPVAFAGGLLNHSNFLSEEVARRLGLCERPAAIYPPVIGAALLAKMEWNQVRNS